MSQARPPLGAEDLFKLAFVGSPQMSPDGRWIAYTVKTTRFEDNKYETSLYLVPSSGGDPRRLTFGDHSDGMPRWSPDGKTLAFVSNRQDDKQQIYLLPMEGGDSRRLTDLDGSISALEWSPGGESLAIAYCPLSEEQKARREAAKKKEAEKRPQFQVHTTIHYKEDGMGFLFDAYTHIHLVNAETGETSQLTDGNVNDMQPVFSPDGKTIAFCSNRMDDPDANLDNFDICLVPVGGGAIRRLATRYGPCMAPSFSPDGKTLAFVGCFGEKGDSFWMDSHIWTVPVEGDDPMDLTPDIGRTVGNYCISDTRDIGEMFEPPLWSPDGKQLTFLLSDSGSVHLCRVSSSGGAVDRVTPGGGSWPGSPATPREGGLPAPSAITPTRERSR